MSIVAMVNSTMLPARATSSMDTGNNSSMATCKYNRTLGRSAGPSARDDGELFWTPSDVSLLLAASFYGTFLTVWISGPIIDRRGPKLAITGVLAICTVVTLLSPLLADFSYGVFFASRLILGMTEGFTMPAISSMASRWFPSGEKSTVVSVYSSGTQVGAGLTSLIAAAICGSVMLGGWRTVFYLYGILCLLMLIAWVRIATDDPDSNAFISEKEKKYLQATLHSGAKKGAVGKNRPPYSVLLRSPAVLAILSCFFGFGFSVAFMQSFLPTYLNEHLWLPIDINGLYALTPFLSQMIFKLILGPIMDFLVRRKILSQTATCRLSQGIAAFGVTLVFLGMAFLPSCQNPEIALVLLILYGVVFCGGSCGFYTSLLVIAPSMTGTVAGLGALIRMFGNIAATSGTAWLTTLGIANKWQIIFIICGALQTISGLIFVFFGSGEVQEWNNNNAVQDKEAKDEEGYVDLSKMIELSKISVR